MADDQVDGWPCPTCTLRNDLTAESCEACGATSPLVLESFACEEQARLAASLPFSSSSTQEASAGAAGAGGADPWAQAECEWAHVEAHQEQRAPRRK